VKKRGNAGKKAKTFKKMQKYLKKHLKNP